MTAMDTTGTANTTDSTGTTNSTGTTDSTDTLIADARARIDALDERIIALVRERTAVSAVVQQARLTAGGRRVSLSRENEILGHYRAELGKPGTALAMTLLELSRGRL